MKLQKKNGKDWFIGLIHFFYAGVIYPYGIALLVSLILVFIFNLDIDIHTKELLPYTLIAVATNLILLIGIWVGNDAFVRLIGKGYYIKKKNSILNYSFAFFALYNVIYYLIGQKNYMPPIKTVLGILVIFLYYIISRKYIPRAVNKEQIDNNEYLKNFPDAGELK